MSPVMHRVIVSVGRESSPSEVSAIEQVLQTSFEVEVRANYIRLSEGQLPLIIDIVISGVIWDAAKAALRMCVKGLLSHKDLQRRGAVIIRSNESQLVFSKTRICLRRNAKEIEFQSIDDLFEYMDRSEAVVSVDVLRSDD